MKKNYFAWILALALMAGGGVMLLRAQGTQNPGMRHWRGLGMAGPGMALEHMGKYLDLSDTQKTQIKSLADEQRPAMQPLMQQLAAARKDMLAATASGAFDQTKVSAIAGREAQVMAQLQVMRLALQSKIYNTVLTSEQKAKVDQMRQRQADRIASHLQNQQTAPK